MDRGSRRRRRRAVFSGHQSVEFSVETVFKVRDVRGIFIGVDARARGYALGGFFGHLLFVVALEGLRGFGGEGDEGYGFLFGGRTWGVGRLGF